jgi:hypothetical protein
VRRDCIQLALALRSLVAKLRHLCSDFAKFEGHDSSNRTPVHYTHSPEQNQASLARLIGLM